MTINIRIETVTLDSAIKIAEKLANETHTESHPDVVVNVEVKII